MDTLENIKKEEASKKEDKKKDFDYIMEKNLTYLLNLDKTIDIEAVGHYTNEYLKMGGKSFYSHIFSFVLGFIGT